jgi:hypothetical protein
VIKVHVLHQEYTEEYDRAEKAEKDVAELKEKRNYQYNRAEEEYEERAEKAEKDLAELEDRNFEHDRAESFRGGHLTVYERLILKLEQEVKELKQILVIN